MPALTVAPAAPDTRSPSQRPLALATLATVGTAFAGLQSIVLPALPQLRESLAINQASSAWILTASLLATSVSTPLLGSLGDTYGKKRLLLISAMTMLAGTILSGIASSLPLMLIGRALQGIGGGVLPLSFAIVRDTFPQRQVAGAIGLISSLLGIGGGLGLVLPGPIVDHLGHRWLFWFPAILTAVTIPGLIAWVPADRARRPGRVNIPSAALMAAGMVAFLLGISQAQAWRWGSPKTITVIAIGAVLVAAWTIRETRSTIPLIDLQTMRLRNVWICAAAAALIGFGMYASFVLLPAYAQTGPAQGGLGESLTTTGFLMLPTALAQLAVGPFIGRLDRIVGTKPLLLSGGLLAGLAYAWLALSHHRESDLITANTLLGLGLGFALPAMANLVVRTVPAEQVGAAMGLNTIMRTIGGAIGGQVTVTIVSSQSAQGHVAPGYTAAFATCAILGLAAAALSTAAHRSAARIGAAAH